jgi:hypothetical protein
MKLMKVTAAIRGGRADEVYQIDWCHSPRLAR